ncbi:MAG: VCBS repeat-containing protein, partial [Anaerolineae bacterium]|nr:VCBS repeat-containing protein [Anaerolineae bacterium]
TSIQDGLLWARHNIFNPATAGGPRRGAFHSLIVADMDGDGDIDVVTAEMEGVPGDCPPRTYIYENVDGRGITWREHVILDAGLGCHALVAGDVTGNGKLDILGKPWRASPDNAVDGSMFVVFLENVSD